MTSNLLVPNQTYTPSFMEKLLGKNYKWWFLVKFWLKANTAYFWSEFFVGLNRTLILLGTCTIFWFIEGAGINHLI